MPPYLVRCALLLLLSISVAGLTGCSNESWLYHKEAEGTQPSAGDSTSTSSSSSSTSFSNIFSNTKHVENQDFSCELPSSLGEFKLTEKSGPPRSRQYYASDKYVIFIVTKLLIPADESHCVNDARLKDMTDLAKKNLGMSSQSSKYFEMKGFPAVEMDFTLAGAFGKCRHVVCPEGQMSIIYYASTRDAGQGAEAEKVINSVEFKLPTTPRYLARQESGEFFTAPVPEYFGKFSSSTKTVTRKGLPPLTLTQYASVVPKGNIFMFDRCVFPNQFKRAEHREALNAAIKSAISSMRAKTIRRRDFLYRGKYEASEVITSYKKRFFVRFLYVFDKNTLYGATYASNNGNNLIATDVDDLLNSVRFKFEE